MKGDLKMEKFNELHNRGIEIVGRYKKSEAEVLEIIQELDKTKTYLKFNCKSLFEYSMKISQNERARNLKFYFRK